MKERGRQAQPRNGAFKVKNVAASYREASFYTGLFIFIHTRTAHSEPGVRARAEKVFGRGGKKTWLPPLPLLLAC